MSYLEINNQLSTFQGLKIKHQSEYNAGLYLQIMNQMSHLLGIFEWIITGARRIPKGMPHAKEMYQSTHILANSVN